LGWWVRPAVTCIITLLSTSGGLQAQADEEHQRSGFWLRAGLDFGSVRVDSSHSGTLSGVRFAAGWALSPKLTVGLRTGIYPDGSGAEGSTRWLIGPELAWWPLSGAGLALRGGMSLLDFQERSELISPDGSGTIAIREQTFHGLVGHIGAAASQPINEFVVFEIGIEVGYAPGGTWRDTASPPVAGHPRSVVITLGFGLD